MLASPTSPQYSPTSPDWEPPSGGGRPAPSPPPAAAAPRQQTPTHVCDSKCGFEGSKAEVLEHEKACPAWAAWKAIALAKRRSEARKRKQRKTDADAKSAALMADAAARYAAADSKRAASTPAARYAAAAASAASSKSAKKEAETATALEKNERKRALAEEQTRKKDSATDLAHKLQVFQDHCEKQAKLFQEQLAGNVPKFWTVDDSPKFEVPKHSDEWNEIEAEFIRKLEIDSYLWPQCAYSLHTLYRTVSRAKWTAFELRRNLIKEDMTHAEIQPTEPCTANRYPRDCARLFHGTSLAAAATISTSGFNRSAGQNGRHGSILGKGTYFSPLPRLPLCGETGSLSNVYTPPDGKGFKHLLLCNVVLGNSILGKPEYDVFPPGVHSTVNRLTTPSKHCVQHDNSINVLYELVVSYKKSPL